MFKLQFLKEHRGKLLLACASLVAVLSYGCQESTPPAKPTTMPTKAATVKKGGAELWAETCARCHNLRPPTQHSNGEWTVIVHHMRVRGNLDGGETEQILAFLKSANQQ